MKIGNKSIHGIFKYSEASTPEIDDLILYNNEIWICKSNDPQGEPSDINTNYSRYLSPDIATDEEVISSIISNEDEWIDKAVSCRTLGIILDSVYNGLTNKGIITLDDGGIDSILNNNYNHGMYAITRDCALGLVNQDYDSPVFVKKYTYNSNFNKYILLELCDYETGMLWFKSIQCPNSSDTNINDLSDWKIVNPSDDIKYIIESLVNQYKSRINNVNSTESILKDNFRFTKLTFPDDQRMIFINGNTRFNGSDMNFPILPNGEKLDYTVTLLIKKESGDSSFYYSASATVSPTSSMEIKIPFNSVGEEATLSINVRENDKIFFGVTVPSIDGAVFTCEKIVIYYQDFYDR